jgi:tetratricopeptide (TPR) repeat protein/Tfp pilus assembly protein PilZ
MVARFLWDGKPIVGVIRNLSEIGLFIQTQRHVPHDTVLTVEIGSGDTFKVEGKVVRCIAEVVDPNSSSPGGVGITLLAAPDRYLALIDRLRKATSKRSSPDDRFEVYLRVHLDWGGEWRTDYTENLSRGGMYLSTIAPLEINSHIRTKIEIPGLLEPIEISGRVTYRMGSDEAKQKGRTAGVGVQFSELTDEARAHIHHYITRLEIHRSKAERRRTDDIPEAGNLSDYLVPEILLWLLRKEATGVLTLTLRNARKMVYFKNGHPIYVQSSLDSEALGRFLVRKGLLQEIDFVSSLDELSNSDMRLGEILLKRQLIDPSVLAESLVSHQEEMLIHSFPWIEGSYCFTSGVDWPDYISILPIRTYLTIFKGIELWYDPALITAWMGVHEGSALRLVSKPPSDATLPPKTVRLLRHISSPQAIKTLAREFNVAPSELLPSAFAVIIAGWAQLDFSKLEEKSPAVKPLPVEKKESKKADGQKILQDKVKQDWERLRSLDFYQLLGVQAAATDKEIEGAFVELSARYAAKENEDPETMHRVSEILSWLRLAYDTLRDKELRRVYARRGSKVQAGTERTAKLELERVLLSGFSNIEKKEFQKAISVLNEGTRKFPKESALSGYLGWAMFNQDQKKNLQRAVELLDKALETDVSDPQLFYYRGEVAAHLNQWEKAERLFVRALRLQPNLHKAMAALERAKEKRIAQNRSERLMTA